MEVHKKEVLQQGIVSGGETQEEINQTMDMLISKFPGVLGSSGQRREVM